MIPDTPYERRQLKMFVKEHKAPTWGAETATRLIDLIASNRWLTVTEMSVKAGDPWEPYSRPHAIELFERAHWLMLRSGEDLSLDGSVANFQGDNIARLSMMRDVLETRPVVELEAQLAAMIAAMPEPDAADASADDDQIVFVRRRKLDPLPSLIGAIGWLHVLFPKVYPAYFDRAELLAAPCHRVEERSDGTIWIWAYEHPLRYDAPGVRDAIAELWNYFASHTKKPV